MQYRGRFYFLLYGSICFFLIVPAESNACTDDDFCYNDITSAVLAAGARYNASSVREDREFLGAILAFPHGFRYTVTAGVPGRDEITARIIVPAGLEWLRCGILMARCTIAAGTSRTLIQDWLIESGFRFISLTRTMFIGYSARVINSSAADKVAGWG